MPLQTGETKSVSYAATWERGKKESILGFGSFSL